jgi:hypothetical protein
MRTAEEEESHAIELPPTESDADGGQSDADSPAPIPRGDCVHRLSGFDGGKGVNQRGRRASAFVQVSPFGASKRSNATRAKVLRLLERFVPKCHHREDLGWGWSACTNALVRANSATCVLLIAGEGNVGVRPAGFEPATFGSVVALVESLLSSKTTVILEWYAPDSAKASRANAARKSKDV